MDSKAVYGLSAIVIALLSHRVYRIGTREPELPPGPPTLPVLGNILDFPPRYAYLKFTEMAKAYGDIVCLKLGNQNLIILTGPRVIRELLEVRGSSTSDRPYMHPIAVTCGGLQLAFARYGRTWKVIRRAAHDMLTPEACARHLAIQEVEGTQLMHDILTQPDTLSTHIRRFTASIILSVVFGIRCPQSDSQILADFTAVNTDWNDFCRPGAHPPMDLITLLKYIPEFLPGGGWKRTSRSIRERQRKLYFGLVGACRNRMKNNRRNGSCMEDILDQQDKYGLTEEQTAYLGGVLLEAGLDTTAVFLEQFVLCMTTHPEVQKKAQAEIDAVIGSSRSPTIEDIDDLPYVQAIIQEVQRFRPVTPLGVPHASTSDEIVDGHLIPKGSIIFANMWGTFHNDQAYEDPHIFNPDRYIQSEFGTKPGVDTTGYRKDLVFGFGRRTCPGVHLAHNSVNLNTMNLLWAFNFDYARDSKTGDHIPIDINKTHEGVIMFPIPFQCSIKPRSQVHVDIIRSQFAKARDTFSQFEYGLNEIGGNFGERAGYQW